MIRGEEGGSVTLGSGIRRTVLRGLVSECIDLICLLLLPSSRIFIGLSRRLFLSTGFLSLRRRWRNAVRLGFLAAALRWGLRRRRRGSGLALWSAARRLRGGLCCRSRRGALLGGARALSRWPAGRGRRRGHCQQGTVGGWGEQGWDARLTVSTARRNSSMPSRLRFPGLAPKSRQIARRVSALSLSHGILEVAAICYLKLAD